jgi:5-methylcytosine-specific restriction endonuclease McrA
MRQRKQSTVKRFLEKRGLTKVPRGKEVDHKVPLKDGGSDTLRNLHLIKKTTHKRKTAMEARRRAK